MRFEIAERSMAPALLPGDYVVAVRYAPVERGSVVVFPHPGRDDFYLVKRVAALPGDEVAGRILEAGLVWVLGDDLNASTDDSRALGPIPIGAIEARVVWRYWPARRIGTRGLRG